MDKNLGLAIGGGAARALCSVGCLEIFEEQGLRFTGLAGTSMGSIIAALAATGHSARAIRDLTAEASLGRYLRFNFRSCHEGLCHLERLHTFLQTLLPETFAGLENPLAIVCTDIDRGQPVVLTEGDLPGAVVASCSIPLLFKPVIRDNRRLLDGGLKCQIPYQPLLERGHPRVVAISSGFLARQKPAYRGLINIGVRSLDLLGKYQIDVARKHPDVDLIEPDIESKGVMSFKNREFFLEKGREAARRYLADRVAGDSPPA